MKSLEDRVAALEKSNRRWQAGFAAAVAVALVAIVATYAAQRASGAPAKQTYRGGELTELTKRIETLEKLLEGVGREKKTGALLFDHLGAKSVVADIGDGKTAVLDGNGLRLYADKKSGGHANVTVNGLAVYTDQKGGVGANVTVDGLAVYRDRGKPTTVVSWEGLQTAAPDESAQTTVSPGSVSVIGRIPQAGAAADEEALVSATGDSVRFIVIKGGKARAAMIAQPDGNGSVLDSAHIDALSKGAESAPKKP